MLLGSSPGAGMRFNLRPLRHKNVAAPSAHGAAPALPLLRFASFKSDYKLQMK
jgi:hypothetical protein